jgi:hypothetical protein
MKYIFSVIIFLILATPGVNASELIGRISTDPQVLANIVNGTSSGQTDSNQGNTNSGQGANLNTSSANQSQVVSSSYQTIRSIAGKKGAKQIKILGISLYPDNSLLRNVDHKIYLVKNGFKRPIVSLKELQKYRGQDIYDVLPEELAYYPTRGHLDGELIKEKGRKEVYAIVGGKKQLISSPSELRKHYRGIEIFSISHKEMGLYSQ